MKRKIVIVFISILIIIVLAIIGLFAYLQLSLFSVKPIMKSALSHEITKVSVTMLEKKEINQYKLVFPYKPINEEITERFIQQELSYDRSVVSAQLDIINKQAFINYRKGNFYLPVYAKVLVEPTQEGIRVSIIPLSYGTKKLDLPAFIDDILYHDIFVEPILLTLEADNFFRHEYMGYTGIELLTEGIEVNYTFVLPQFNELMQQIEIGLDNDFIEVYRNGNITQQEALIWIDLYKTQLDVVLGKVFDDFKQKGPIIKDLLALLKPVLLDEVYIKYPLIQSLVPRAEVDQTRVSLSGSAVLKYGQMILETYDLFVQNKNITYVNHQPFDSTTLKGITINSLNTYKDFDFPNGFLSQFKLIEHDDVVNVVYTTPEGMFILLERDTYRLLTPEEYEEVYASPVFTEGVLTEDPGLYESLYFALFNFYKEDVFFRYLKDDGEEAFAIVSKVSDYQNFDVVALQKKEDGTFKIIENGITSVDAFHKKQPDFNLNLATRMFENTTLLMLNGRTRTNMYEGFVERGYADPDETMIYCSFDGNKYISILLNSGEKYIYTIYRGAFLEELYPIDEAFETFNDIPPIILLQNVPESNTLN